MIPTPTEVLPLVECAVPDLTAALVKGTAFADGLQPDREVRDPWYWSHSARWRARRYLALVTKNGWGLAEKAANSAIHLHFDGIHSARVLKSMNGTTPHAGPNNARQRAWNFPDQLRIGNGQIPWPIRLIFDWRPTEDGPIVHVGLTKGAGDYLNGAELHWRVAVTGDADTDLTGLAFDPSDPSAPVAVTLKIDHDELDGGAQ